MVFLLFCKRDAGDSDAMEGALVALWKCWAKLRVLPGPELPLAVNIHKKSAVTQTQGRPRSDESLSGRESTLISKFEREMDLMGGPSGGQGIGLKVALREWWSMVLCPSGSQ